jgi:smad nuclear-interacting protein 1
MAESEVKISPSEVSKKRKKRSKYPEEDAFAQPKPKTKSKAFNKAVYGGSAIDEKNSENENDEEEIDNRVANFGLSGALAKDKTTGNLRNGILLKYSEPLDAVEPAGSSVEDIDPYRLYVFKGDDMLEKLHIHRQSWYLIGRDRGVADIHIAHASCSKQHAVLQYRRVTNDSGDRMIKLYLLDCESTHKTHLNGKAIEASRYYELLDKDVIRFGASTREYVVIQEKKKNEKEEEKELK